MIKNAIRQLIRDQKEKIRYLKYKNTLVNNPMNNDIYIVEFPKSGITWLQHIIGNIELQLSGRKETITFYNHHQYLPDIHQMRGSNINRLLNRTFIKSHAEFNPYYYSVIYLIRNPFDVMVSYYNFMNDHGNKNDFETFVKSKYGIRSWKNHLNSWWYKKVDAQRIHIIKYENLIKNPKEEIDNLYQNLGLKISEDILNYSLEHSSIENMSRCESHYRKYNINYTMNFVGKNHKHKKEELLTKDIKDYILTECHNEISQFYPNLIKEK